MLQGAASGDQRSSRLADARHRSHALGVDWRFGQRGHNGILDRGFVVRDRVRLRFGKLARRLRLRRWLSMMPCAPSGKHTGHGQNERLWILLAVYLTPRWSSRRLLGNQTDIGNAIKPYYGDAAGGALTTLLQSHINDAVAVLKAAKSGNAQATKTAEAAFYANGVQIQCSCMLRTRATGHSARWRR